MAALHPVAEHTMQDTSTPQDRAYALLRQEFAQAWDADPFTLVSTGDSTRPLIDIVLDLLKGDPTHQALYLMLDVVARSVEYDREAHLAFIGLGHRYAQEQLAALEVAHAFDD